jgi:hypothetical protein
VRPERGRGADPAEQGVHRPVPQQAHVIDAVGARYLQPQLTCL